MKRNFMKMFGLTATLAFAGLAGATTGPVGPMTDAEIAAKAAHEIRMYSRYTIWDNLNIHCGVRWQRFNERHGGRFHFVYTPKHASWVNQVEIWFAILQRRVLRYGNFRCREELRERVEGFIEHWSEKEAHPFRWTFRGRFRQHPSLRIAA